MTDGDEGEAGQVDLGQFSHGVVAENLKSIAGAGAYYSSLVMAEAQTQQARMNQIGNAVTSKAADMIMSYDPSQAVSEAKIMGANTKLSEQLADLGGAVSQFVEMIRNMQPSIREEANVATK